MNRKVCLECKEGEHDNYDDNIIKVKVIDPETGKVYRKGLMCLEHRELYLSDGFWLEKI